MVAERKPGKGGRARIFLDLTSTHRIKRRLLGQVNGLPSRFGFVASEPWADYCIAMIELGKVPPRKKMQGLERDLYERGVYPPGGEASAMVETFRGRHLPPDYTSQPTGEREDRIVYHFGENLRRTRRKQPDLLRYTAFSIPSSCSAVMLQRARECKAGPPQRRRLRQAKA